MTPTKEELRKAIEEAEYIVSDRMLTNSYNAKVLSIVLSAAMSHLQGMEREETKRGDKLDAATCHFDELGDGL